MKPIVSIIMGSTSDLPVMEKAAKLLDEMQVPFEMNALSAHRTPEAVEEFAKNAASRGIKVIIAAAGMAAALPGVIAASTTLPVIGVPIKGSVLDGVDALYSIIQMPPGIPVATVAINGAMNAAILAVQILALADAELATKFADYKTGLKNKIVKANELAEYASNREDLVFVLCYEDAFDLVDEKTQYMWLRMEMEKVAYDTEKDKMVLGCPQITVPVGVYEKYKEVAVDAALLGQYTIAQIKEKEKEEAAQRKALKTKGAKRK